ncbi:hypothetical protein GCM10027435_05330 [Haloparvum alkalitolerans]|uniref:hypothetical protein n=1 Tax=Haloparvum alkalitolerans TaxID=1042953 RepID=UPI003CEE2EB3
MQRRRLLALLAAGTAGLAGCNAADDPAENDPATRTTDPATDAVTDRPPTDGAPSVATPPPAGEQHDHLDLPDGDGFAQFERLTMPGADRAGALTGVRYRTDEGVAVRLRVLSSASAEGPARIAATATNESPFVEHVRFLDIPPFHAPLRADAAEYADVELRDTSYRGDLQLLPTAESDLIETDPSVERTDAGVWRPAAGVTHPDLPEVLRLEPGDTLYGEYVVVGHREGEGSLQPARYRQSAPEGGFAITLWERGAPGPSADSRFADRTVPDLAGTWASDGTSERWFHEADASTPTYLYPSAERVETPGRIRFTYVNHGEEIAGGNPYDWSLHKLVDGEWFHIAPRGINQPMGFVQPGDTETWDRTFYGGDGLDTGETERREALVFGGTDGVSHLGGGTYAARVGISVDDRDPAALFELVGDETVVTPTTDAETERPGGELVVTDQTRADAERPRDLVAERVAADATEAGFDRRLIPEQVMQPWYAGFRNTLAFRSELREALDRIRLRTSRSVATNAVGYDREAVTVAFDGAAYRIEKRTPA